MRLRVHAKNFLLLILLSLILVSTLLLRADVASAEEPSPIDFPTDQLSEWLGAVNLTSIQGHVEYLTNLGTRATGYTGNLLAAQYIYDKLVEYGLVNVTYHNFTVVDAVSHGANITVGGETVQVHPLLPNLVCPSTTGPGGIKGPLVYAGNGYLEDFDGWPINGSIVLMDWDTLDRWLNAARLGAKAVVFLHSTDPSHTLYGDTNTKNLPETPLNFPRFYADQEATSRLLAHLDIPEKKASGEALLLSTQRFERVETQNVLGWVEGTSPTDNGWTAEESIWGWTNPYKFPVAYFAISSYYDSGSIAPSAAPGAQEALGIATLLELAKFLSQPGNRPVHSVPFVAFGAHHQGQGGMRFALDYLWNHGWTWEENTAYQPGITPDGARTPLGLKIRFAMNLDFSTGTEKVYFATDSPAHGSTTTGGPHRLSLVTLKDYFTSLIGELEGVTGKSYTHLYEHYWSSKIPQAAEILDTAGANSWKWWPHDTYAWFRTYTPAICLTTAQDSRPYHFTPFDTMERVNWQNLQTQLEMDCPVILSILNQDDDWLQKLYEEFWFQREAGGSGYAKLTYMTYHGVAPEIISAFGSVTGRAGYWNEEENWYKPVANSLVAFTPGTNLKDGRTGEYRFHQIYDFTDEHGRFSIYFGIFSDMEHGLDAWVVNETTGDVIMGPDLGMHKYAPYPYLIPQYFGAYMGGATTWTTMNDTINMGWFTVFNCSTWVVYDVSSLTGLLTAKYHITPESYGSWTYGLPPTMYLPGELSLGSPGLSLSVLAVEPNKLLEYVPLMNSSKEAPLGAGYVIDTGGRLHMPFTTLAYAENLYWINEDRFIDIISFNPTVEETYFYKGHMEARDLLQKAREALANYQYSEASLHAFRAKALEEETYGYVKRTVVDAASAVTFLSAFFVPFTYLAEKILFGYRGTKRIFSFLGTFTALTAILYLLHPGFTLAGSPPMIIIGFSILLLTFPLIIIVSGYMTDLLGWLRRRRLGIHEAPVSRVGEIGNSFFIGVENIRRLKLRSALTLLSITIIVSALISLTSIEPIRSPVVQKVLGAPTYTGVYIHKHMWGEGEAIDLGDQTVQLLKIKYGSEATIQPRAWKYYSWPSIRNMVKKGGFHTRYGEMELTTPSLLGLSPQDEDLWGFTVLYGRWFLPGEERVIMLTEDQADFLGIDKTQLDMGVAPTVYFETLPYRVVGIVDGKEFEYLAELDGQEITPIILDDPMIQAGHWSFHEKLLVYSDGGSFALILPYEEVRNLNGMTASVSLVFEDASRAAEAARELSLILPSLNVYVSAEDQTFLYKTGAFTTVWGLQNQIVPMALVVLTLLNVTLGSVYERRRHIATYSSIGLSPLHIATMFLAETTVYALLGGILGYTVAMILYKPLTPFLPGLVMNPSSGFVLIAVGGAILATLLASIYPMFVASRMVTPSLERAWKPPTTPKGDTWELPLPFLAADEAEAQQIFSYITEYLASHSTRESPDFFRTTELKPTSGFMEEKSYRAVECDVTLQPVEAGVAQNVTFYTTETMPPKWEFRVVLKREKGGMQAWTRMGRRYVDLLRKQMLLWRSLGPEQRKRYTEMREEN